MLRRQLVALLSSTGDFQGVYAHFSSFNSDVWATGHGICGYQFIQLLRAVSFFNLIHDLMGFYRVNIGGNVWTCHLAMNQGRQTRQAVAVICFIHSTKLSMNMGSKPAVVAKYFRRGLISCFCYLSGVVSNFCLVLFLHHNVLIGHEAVFVNSGFLC